jgi:hypothetical protein
MLESEAFAVLSSDEMANKLEGLQIVLKLHKQITLFLKEVYYARRHFL